MKPTLEELAKAPSNRLQKYCCKKCGGVLAQVFDASGKAIVICGANHCQPLKIKSMFQKTADEFKDWEDASEVAKEYPDLFPKPDPEKIEKTKQALYPKE
jgi:hypothetical protein